MEIPCAPGIFLSMTHYLETFFLFTSVTWVIQVAMAIFGITVTFDGKTPMSKTRFLLLLIPGYCYGYTTYFAWKGLIILVKSFREAPLYTESYSLIHSTMTPEEEVKEALNISFEDLPKMVNKNESLFLTIVKWRLVKGI